MTDDRPTAMDLRRPLAAAALLVVGMVAASAWAWPQLPDDARVPIHWGIGGEIDGTAPKPFGLLFLPALTAIVLVLLRVTPRFEPRRSNLARSGRAYGTLVVALAALLAGLHGVVVLTALGEPIEVTTVVGLGIGGLFVILGNVLGTIRSNYLFGIRTPWTLSSDLSWNRTHRFGGRLWFLLGLLLMATGFADLPGEGLFALLLGGLAVTMAAIVWYSYRIWSLDPERRDPATRA